MAKIEDYVDSDSSGREEEQGVPEITEEEQWRIIQETGILNQAMQAQEAQDKDNDVPQRDMADEIFESILYLIPFSCLYIGMDIMIKQQYAQHPSFKEELGQLVSAVPILALFIFYTNRFKHTLIVQAGLFFASILASSRLIWIVNKESFGIVIQQCPPLGVIWVYAIAQLYLPYACVTLVLEYFFVKYYNLKIIF
ncbi:SubName: Full=Uncharacterized protein {ECO:0000313/EMBL:CCA70931.1} [Serendipita indica DSM 11827]|uniref:DUF7719 domain-containing protein n=1 Tax=Serendipita indica (strain DSM 11827) TaxID=1109443 RepID=G4THY8_SERID|nr:SubName: Full=Uncharacterized protein {ECO:0000313/EMBL:CCA70931.1} [Serendipita indica DSM 11827]CCA70931.1 hypothetical protein PIIN_04867 [Serendipita indica DSM 11827]